MERSKECSFLAAYAMVLAESAGRDHRDNHDWRRFGPEERRPRSWQAKLEDSKRGLWRRAGYASVEDAKSVLFQGLHFAEPHAAHLQWLYDRLADDQSRDLLARLIAFRALGHRRVKLPFNRPEYWQVLAEIEQAAQGRETLDPCFMGWRLPKLDLRPIGYPIDVFYTPMGAAVQFVHQQYRCTTATVTIEAREGDVVVDAGGCWGDTALYFAHKVGDRGRVYSYEFLPDNIKVYHRNLALNPELAPRIELLPHPLWSSGGAELFVSQCGPGTSVSPERRTPEDAAVRTMAIDELMARPDVTRIDFIKMDIEGAEQAALAGAQEVLRAFRPRLAITVYHSLFDFWEIPRQIDAWGLGYQFYLRHFTTHAEETVLFATCEQAL
jgi:FkbM family methyltransferase